MLPYPFKQELTTTSKPHAQYEHFSVVFVSYNDEIPAVVNKDEENGTISERSFKVPGYMTIDKIVAYLYKTVGIKDYILATDRDTAEPTEYIELGIQIHDKKLSDKEFFLIDNRLEL